MPNIAIISTAHIHTRDFLKNLTTASDGRRVAVIWDDNVDRGERYAAEFKAPFEPDLAKVVADKSIDGFLICAENTRHLALLEQVIPAGKPVFCEKPLVTTVRDLEKVEALLAKTPVPVFCGHFMPWFGDILKVRQLVREGAFGKIFRARYRNAHTGAFGRWFDSPDLAWFADPALAGGGAMMDLGIHAVHLLCTLFGAAESVWAVVTNESGAYPQTDDYGLIEIRFQNGVLGTVEAAWTQNGGIGGLEISGREMSAWNTPAGLVCNPGGKEQAVEKLPEQPTRVDRLVAVIRGEIPAEELQNDLAAIKNSVRVMEAAYASAKSGAWVKVG